MKSRIFIAGTIISFAALMAACNHNMSSDPLSSYPELTQLSVPRSGSPEEREVQDARFSNTIHFKVNPSMVFHEGTDNPGYEVVVQVMGNNVEYDVQTLNFPNGAQLLESGAREGGIRKYLIKWTPGPQIAGKDGYQRFPDVGLNITIKSYGRDDIERTQNRKILEGAPRQTFFTLHVVRASVVQRPTILPLEGFSVEENKDGKTVTVRVKSAGGMPTLEKRSASTQPCLYDSSEFVTIGAPQAEGEIYHFPVTFKPTGVNLSGSLSACQTSAEIKSGFTLVATNSQGVPSEPAAVNAAIKRNVIPVIAVSPRYANFQGGVKGKTETFFITSPAGKPKFIASQDVTIEPSKQDGNPKVNCEPDSKNISKLNCHVEWRPSCDKPETIKLTLKASTYFTKPEFVTATSAPIALELVNEKIDTTACQKPAGKGKK